MTYVSQWRSLRRRKSAHQTYPEMQRLQVVSLIEALEVFRLGHETSLDKTFGESNGDLRLAL